jgi:ubiquitin-protein ligase E3 A
VGVRVLRLLANLNDALAAEAADALALPPAQRSRRVAAALEADRRASLYGAFDRWAVPGAPLGGLLPPEDFASPDVSALPDALLLADYQRWGGAGYKRTLSTPLVLLGYPFLLDAAAKRRVMLLESTVSMQAEANSALLRSLAGGGAVVQQQPGGGVAVVGGESPYLELRVRRASVLSDTLNQLCAHPPHALRKQLKVVFVGEEALDAGGVTKELFQLLTQQLLDPVYGLWVLNDATREYWFHPAAAALITDSSAAAAAGGAAGSAAAAAGGGGGGGGDGMDREYFAVGLLLGLAIYNGVLLDFRLPLPLYRKLLGARLGLGDLRHVHPLLASGLQQLLAYDGGDDADVFGLTFEAAYEAFGSTVTVELVPGGSERPVTAGNKWEYARALVDWHLNRSVAGAFAALQRGFRTVVTGHALSLLRPEELELMVAGTPELDFGELEAACVYDGGFTPVHPTVKAFWRVVHGLSAEARRRLLVFVTGCPKAPIGGLRNLPFKLQRNGGDSDRLPTASTCFNTLLLPEYASEGKLRERLTKAISECAGFGLK